jgi:hypothetical protein
MGSRLDMGFKWEKMEKMLGKMWEDDEARVHLSVHMHMKCARTRREI